MKTLIRTAALAGAAALALAATGPTPPAGEDHRGAPPPSRGTRSVDFVPSTYDAKAHTVEVVLSAGTRVKRWYGFEEILIDPAAIDLSRVTAGQCRVLDSHNAYEIDAILGSVLSARIENGQLIGLLKFGATENAVKAEGMVARGELTAVSIGYQVSVWRNSEILTDPATGEETYVWQASAWTLMEVSFVSVPADTSAVVRSAAPSTSANSGGATENDEMHTRNAPGAAAPATVTVDNPDPTRNTAPAAPAAAVVVRFTPTEAMDFASQARDFGIEAEARTLVEQNTAGSISIEAARAALLSKAAERQRAGVVPALGGARITTDEVDTRRDAVSEALLHRFRPGQFKLTDKGRDFRGLRMMEIARELLVASGQNVRGLAPMELAQRALTTSDLPNIVANVANKSLQAGYAAEVRTFQPFCTQHDAADFKQISSVVMGEGSNLEVVNEHGEFKRGSVTDSAEKWNLATYGKVFSFSRQLLINDDMSAFTRLPFMFGSAGVRMENDIVWAILTANAAMADGVTLFHANHSNLTSGATSTLSGALGIKKMRSNLMTQKGQDGNQTLNLLLKYILVPAALATDLEAFISPLLYASQTGNVVPEFFRGLTPIVEGRLDASSTTAYYGACDPTQMATIEYGYLQGQDGVYLETRQGFESDGTDIKVRHDFGAKAVNWRGLQKSAGA